MASSPQTSQSNPRDSDLRCLCGHCLTVLNSSHLYPTVAAVSGQLQSKHLFVATISAAQHSIASHLVPAIVSSAAYPAHL